MKMIYKVYMVEFGFLNKYRSDVVSERIVKMLMGHFNNIIIPVKEQ